MLKETEVDIFLSLCRLLEAWYKRNENFLFSHINYLEKQPFADVLPKSYSEQFLNIHKKAPVLKSLFNKVADLKTCNFI